MLLQSSVMHKPQSIADKQQLVRDWVWFNKQHYKRIGRQFDLGLVDSIYCALKQRRPVSAGQVAALNSIIRSWHIQEWQAEHYPVWKGRAPVPVVKPPDRLDHCAFLPDDDDV